MALQIGILYNTYTLVKELRRTNELLSDMNSRREEFAKLLDKTEKILSGIKFAEKRVCEPF